MASNNAKEEKAVVVRVYVERQKRRSRNGEKSDEWNLQKVEGKGYSRRAQLFDYSQTLRQSASKLPPLSSSPLAPDQRSPIKAAVQRKPKRSSCLGNWRIFFPKLCRSSSSLEAKKDLKKKNTKNAAKDHLQQQQNKWRCVLPTFGKNNVRYRGQRHT